MDLRFVAYQDADFEYCNALLETNMAPYFNDAGIVWDKGRYASEIDLGIVRIVYAGDEKIGFLHLSEREQKGYINTIQLSPGHRNKGFGRQMLRWTEEQFGEMGKLAVELNVFKSSPALRLYQRIGYEIAKEKGKKYLMAKIL